MKTLTILLAMIACCSLIVLDWARSDEESGRPDVESVLAEATRLDPYADLATPPSRPASETVQD